MILAIYVDDGLITGSDTTSVELMIKYLQEQFEIKSMNVGCFLGFEIERMPNGSIFIHQTAYAKKILRKFCMEESYPVCVPSDPNQILSKFENSKESDFRYRNLVGSLMYLVIATRLDIPSVDIWKI